MTGEAGALAQRRDGAVEEAGIAAEFVDDVPLEPRALTCGKKGMRADKRGDDAAAIDVTDQHDRHVGRLGEAHIRDVALP
jgi:hypothetical protein